MEAIVTIGLDIAKSVFKCTVLMEAARLLFAGV